MAKGKLILRGTIELLSPALIGCGRNDRTDSDLLLDSTGKPFIPATSFVGVLKHFIEVKDKEMELKRFWGFTKEESGQQSVICCSDLYCLESRHRTVIRDGIKIDNKTGIVKSGAGAKYDYEVVERGTTFYLNLEVNCLDNDKTFNRRMIATIRDILENGRVQIGAKTNSGLGKVKLTNAHVYEFDFSKKGDVLKWLKKDYSTPNPFTELPFDIPSRTFSINAVFNLKNSFISRSYSADPQVPDAESIKSGDDFVITGTSLRGAIRARAERILNTIGKPPNILTDLFGNVDVEKRSKYSKKGRIRIDEVILPKFISELQDRIKIDRFTGGTMEGALFETMVLFNQYDRNSINLSEKVRDVKITIQDYEPYEAGLMLLILKDLWTGDLAVGGEKGVGRGVFEGIEATIHWDNQIVSLKKDAISRLSQLQFFVDALQDQKEGSNAGK